MTSDSAVESAVDQISELLDKRIGLRPESTLRGRLRRSLRDESTARGEEPGDYVLALARSRDLLQSLVNRVTVQESGFFRHPDHFQVLADHVLRSLAGPAHIWSAGCANGQEPYSLAMVLSELEVAGSVHATDLSTTALARTAAGLYTTGEITGISPARRRRHLLAEGPGWRVAPSVRSRVVTTQHNLVGDVPAFVQKCQVVFCRNVLIYFAPDRARDFLDSLAAAMSPGAYLFLGSAESLWQVTDRFRAVRLGESFVYRRVEAASRPVRRATTAARPVEPGVGGKRTNRPPEASALGGRTPSRATPDTAPARRRPPAPHREPPNVFQPVKLASAGQQALALGDSGAAVVAFRKWVYLTPDDPLASFHLGLALEAGGHATAAQRAYGVSLGVLLDGGPTLGAEVALEGYAPAELLRLLETKQAGSV